MENETGDNNFKQNRKKFKFNLRKLRLSLKYRPDVLKLVLGMRKCIRKKEALIKSLQKKVQTEIRKTSTSFTQTEEVKIISSVKKPDNNKGELQKQSWNVDSNEGSDKSIAEQVKEVAQNTLQESGMVYVESAGMYYDYKTGYYYNTELGLYYHTDTGCYYYYSNEKQNFVFHSYPDKSGENEALIAHEKKKAKKNKKAAKAADIDNLTKQLTQDDEHKPKRRKTKNEDDCGHTDKTKSVNDQTENNKDDMQSEVKGEELEDGECSDTASETDNQSTSTASDDETISKHHPPCMRVIVRETTLPKLKVGTLYLITKDGGTLGREGDHHSIIIKDQNISRNHLEITYDMDNRVYVAIDLGSKNGTILNGARMSENQEKSGPMQIVHGSTIQLGETKLLCHVHPGNDTCGHCEPGLIMESQEKEKVAYTRTCSVHKQHQLELARLKNKYAPKPLAIEETAYNDRARARRLLRGSSHHAEKTHATDLHTFITEENKGFKMLEKMGWSKGEGLGKESQGDKEPIPLVSNEGKSGLGSSSEQVAPKTTNTLGPATLRLAARTKMLQPPAKAFQLPFEEDSE